MNEIKTVDDAAKTYEKRMYGYTVGKDVTDTDCSRQQNIIDIDEAFKAGAEWQKEKTAWVYLKEAKDAVIALEKEKGEPLNPRVAFVNGARWQKQQMLEGAVECVVENWNPEPHPEITIPLNPEVFGVGDKVKVIIVKENE